jgi:predicted acyl esterase
MGPRYQNTWYRRCGERSLFFLLSITIPMLVCASFSDHGLHTMGSFRAFIKAKSEHKWVYTHRTGKWDVYYSPDVQEMTRDFMDCGAAMLISAFRLPADSLDSAVLRSSQKEPICRNA